MMLTKVLYLGLPLFTVAQSGFRCRDDPDFIWWGSYTGGVRRSFDCAYLTDSPSSSENERRQLNNCDKRSEDDVLVRSMCRRSCDDCQNDFSGCEGSNSYWRDSEGRSCFWYSSIFRCNEAYRYRLNDGSNASWKCCSCVNRNFPSPANQPSRPSQPSWNRGCETSNSGNWKDSEARSCRWYSSSSRCKDAYRYRRDDGSNASWKCCSCVYNEFDNGGRYPYPSPSNYRPGNNPFWNDRHPYHPANNPSSWNDRHPYHPANNPSSWNDRNPYHPANNPSSWNDRNPYHPANNPSSWNDRNPYYPANNPYWPSSNEAESFDNVDTLFPDEGSEDEIVTKEE